MIALATDTFSKPHIAHSSLWPILLIFAAACLGARYARRKLVQVHAVVDHLDALGAVGPDVEVARSGLRHAEDARGAAQVVLRDLARRDGEAHVRDDRQA